MTLDMGTLGREYTALKRASPRSRTTGTKWKRSTGTRSWRALQETGM